MTRDLFGIVVQPLDLHLVNVGSIPIGPTHGEGRLQPHPGDVLTSTPNDRKSPRSGLNLEGRLSDPQIFFTPSGLFLLSRPSSRPTSKVAETLEAELQPIPLAADLLKKSRAIIDYPLIVALRWGCARGPSLTVFGGSSL